jgi:hypothetical protein
VLSDSLMSVDLGGGGLEEGSRSAQMGFEIRNLAVNSVNAESL